MKKIFSAFLLIVSIMSGCKKDKFTSYYLTEESKHFGSFDKGSYWIYKNDSSMEEDSLYVTSIEKAFVTNEYLYGDKRTEVQLCQVHINSIIDTNFYLMPVLVAGENEITSCMYNFNLRSHTKSSWSDGVIIKTFNDSTTVIEKEDKPVDIYDQYTINNNVFTNVCKVSNHSIHFNTTYPINPQNTTMYFVKDVGVVKWETLYTDGSNDKWSLLRYHVVIAE